MSDEVEEGGICTPPELRNLAREMVDNQLPEKSRKRYLQTYSNFLKWQAENNVTGLFSENILLVYFNEQSKKKCGTTLWSMYSMLRCLIKKKNRTDISKYNELQEFLQSKSKNHKPKQAPVFSESDIRRFILEAPDHTYLATKVVIIFGVLGACRADEMVNLMTHHVKRIDSPPELMYFVSIPEENKTNTSRSFTVTDQTFFSILERYINLRPSDMPSGRFLVKYKDGRCVRQYMGKNKISKSAKEIAKFLNLSNADSYTGHSFRRTSTTTLADAGANSLEIKRHGGWKSSSTAERYVEKSKYQKLRTESMITSRINIPTPSTSDTSSANPGPSSADPVKSNTFSSSSLIETKKKSKFMFKRPKLCHLISPTVDFGPSSSKTWDEILPIGIENEPEEEVHEFRLSQYIIESELSEEQDEQELRLSQYITEDYVLDVGTTNSHPRNSSTFSLQNCTVTININNNYST